MKKIILLIILLSVSQKTFALELDTFDNLRLFLYSPQMLYNKWVDLYESWDYEKSSFYFNVVKCKWNNELCAKKMYNSGNANYKIWDISTDSSEKQVAWENAIKDYSESLKYKFDEETKQNLDFVMAKLNELKNKKEEEKKQQEEEKNKQEQEQKNNTQNKTDKTENKKEEEKQEQKEKNKNSSEWQETPQIVQNQTMGIWWNESQYNTKLSPEEKKEIEEYYQKLKNEEKQNQEFFNKKNNNKQEESPFDQFLSPFRFFDSDPFFDDIWDASDEKDW